MHKRDPIIIQPIKNEQANLLKNGWRDEGIGWYAVKNGYASTIPALQYPHPLKFQFDGEKIAKHVFELVNALRQYNHLEPLVWNKEAKKVSDFRVWETMLLFDHTRPDGRKWDSVADDLHLKLPDYNGENIAATGLHHQSNEELADEFFDMWLHSMGHFLNMVKPDYREFATSYAYANGWVYGVQNFY
ncbi:CAP domain-containing protein [Enterococcus cecorum]|uniref:CAP domain-containing protein n=1 Tax=Enterococcus cecorum TaxID=44008 RepID=UPI00209BE688|nr:CAP domain-containing protein [Enterococcus cecorum]